MDRQLYPILALFLQILTPRWHLCLQSTNARIQFLQAQIAILRSRVPAGRIVPAPREKAELLRLGTGLGHDIDALLAVVKPATYRRWLREKRLGLRFKRSGRPRIAEATRRLARRMATENLLWGYQRIVGELRKLGCRLSSTTVKRILAEEGILPVPSRPEQHSLQIAPFTPRPVGIRDRSAFTAPLAQIKRDTPSGFW